MSGPLWLPPGSAPPRRASLPTGDLRLPDGRRLLHQGARRLAGDCGLAAAWRCRDGLAVLGTVDPTPHGNLLHVSLSYADRDPDWATIRAVRDLFFGPDLDVMMVLPCAVDYVNDHPHCFHLWQTPHTWGMR